MISCDATQPIKFAFPATTCDKSEIYTDKKADDRERSDSGKKVILNDVLLK